MNPPPLASRSAEPNPVVSGPHGLPLLRLGFRPFYLGAAAVAAIAVPVWIALWSGTLHGEPALPAMLWHAHEMLFGFAITVIIGFLLTAVKAWTGLPTPRGTSLGVLASLWLAARLAGLGAPYALFAALDVSLLPLVAIVITRVLLRAGNRRNLPLAAILGLLAVANACFHASVLGLIDLPPLLPLHAALALIVLIVCVMAGRVVPMFTANATGVRVTAAPRLDRASFVVTGAALALWVFAPPTALGGLVLAAAAALQLARQLQWAPGAAWSKPILWILHLAYAWLPLGLALLALAQFDIVAASLGQHAIAVGTIGGLIIGMVTRTARGHTGRPLVASTPEVAAYVLVLLAALLRVLVPIALPQFYTVALVGAATAWSCAFVLYLWLYVPWLTQTRLDGKDG